MLHDDIKDCLLRVMQEANCISASAWFPCGGFCQLPFLLIHCYVQKNDYSQIWSFSTWNMSRRHFQSDNSNSRFALANQDGMFKRIKVLGGNEEAGHHVGGGSTDCYCLLQGLVLCAFFLSSPQPLSSL